MKIRSDIYEILQQQAQGTKASPKGTEGTTSFDALLLKAQASGQGTISADEAMNTIATSGKMIDPASFVAKLDGQDIDKQNEDVSLFATIAEQADGMLNTFDQYAKVLGSGASQRQMWNLLEGMNSQLAGMRTNLDAMSTSHEGMEALLNDMEVMTAAETFKMNRGDYQ